MRAAIRPFNGFQWGVLRGFGTRRHVDNRENLRATRWVTSTAAVRLDSRALRSDLPCCRANRASPLLCARINPSPRDHPHKHCRRSREPDWRLFFSCAALSCETKVAEGRINSRRRNQSSFRSFRAASRRPGSPFRTLFRDSFLGARRWNGSVWVT